MYLHNIWCKLLVKCILNGVTPNYNACAHFGPPCTLVRDRVANRFITHKYDIVYRGNFYKYEINS